MKFHLNLQNSRYMQYVSSLVATLIISNAGMYMSWPSPSLVKLNTTTESPIERPLTTEESSWVASGFMFGTIIGGLFVGIIIDKLGRKNALLVGALPMFIPWVVIYFAKSVPLIISMRIIGGIAGVISWAGVPVYTGEITDKDIRGKMGTTFNFFKLMGGLFVLGVGPFVSYEVLALSCSVLPIVFMVWFFFMPESPYYLIKVGKREAAFVSLTRLSSDKDKKMIEKRLNEIQETVDYDMRNKSSMWEFLTKKEYRRSFIVMLGIKTLQQFSGVNAIDPYLQTIIESSGSSISPQLSSIISGAVQIPAVLLSAVLVDKVGRKPLLIFSSIGCGLSLTAEGVFFYLKLVANSDVSAISWLPTVALVTCLIMNSIGVYTLPYVLSGELFATNIKGSATTFMTVYGATAGFLVAKYFEPISNAWGMYTMFWIFASFCYIGATFVFFLLPETKGKTFMEIQAKLNNRPS